ncbi:winged helix-turn-helix transcriptional regulator [Phytoactinopolyspora alkaliphila]|uniref:Winged helix-turn-helix transcriptional regulator n=1 Tax=Phytoactinopolyspora alkaliphila TaxID=1783498 RepID=A0A6N9YLX0_9ACTN|nr:metalloregulator ArsR/SmtB family transcription factor [Phytoactinopolyspora alkaliphila]NED95974.1 winged helix-turn-helix transcriptional regulator [Phytoactinopolyspora alkaliphila]
MMTSVETDIHFDQQVAWLRALADPVRLKIVHLLAAEALCTCHLVDETGARQTNVSNHLRFLRDAGLVESEPHGRYTYHRLRPEAMNRLAQVVNQLADATHVVQSQNVRRPCP